MKRIFVKIDDSRNLEFFRGDPHGELRQQNVLTRIEVDAAKVADSEFGITMEEAENVVEECRL